MAVVPPPKRFKDFEVSYIKQLAQTSGYTYSDLKISDENENSLYNNPHTKTRELFSLTFNIEGLVCEFYTADHLPLSYKDVIPNYEKDMDEEPARVQVQVFSIQLPYDIENVYVESKTNITLGNLLNTPSVNFSDAKQVQLEGDFNYFFRVFVPENEELNAFIILAPNIMQLILQDAGDYDFEFSGNRINFYKTFGLIHHGVVPMKKSEFDNMLQFGTKAASQLARAARPAKVHVTSDYTPLWQQYRLTKRRFILFSLKFLTIVGLFFISLTIPLLWPISIILVLWVLIKYRVLNKKRRKLQTNWSNL